MSSKTALVRSFSDLGVSPKLVSALHKQGITSPFPIQVATLPDALEGHDILGQGKTGSGKTLAFGIALLNNIQHMKAESRRPLAIVLAPTRELAQQIDEVLFPLAKAIGHSTVVVAGGLSFKKQISALQRGVSVVVATPGRLIDLMNRREIRLDGIQITVLDEADMMADMGFMPDMKLILDETNSESQRMLFSATLERGVDGLVKKYLHKPRTHTVTPKESEQMKMDHYIFIVESGQKSEIAQQIAAREGKTLLFVRTRHGADKLVLNLSKAGVYAGALHSGKSQSVRNRTLETFKYRDSAVLVATDIAARGIHVDGIDLVVHVDVPADHKDYVHRSGRTARAGEVGTVVTLATKGQQKAINGITSKAGITASVMPVKPLDEQLVAITGAKKPSGIACEEEIPESIFRDEKPARGRSGNRGSRSRTPRSRDARRTRDSESARGSRDSRRTRDSRDESASRDRRDSRSSAKSGFERETRDTRRGRDTRDTRTTRDARDTRRGRDSRDTDTSRSSRATSRSRDTRETSRDSRRTRDSRDTNTSRGARSTSRSRDTRSARDSRDSGTARSSRSTSRSRDTRESSSARDTRGFREKRSDSKGRTTKTAGVSKKRSGRPRAKRKPQFV
jgi:superfamily II DNA/RNA helicase